MFLNTGKGHLLDGEEIYANSDVDHRVQLTKQYRKIIRMERWTTKNLKALLKDPAASFDIEKAKTYHSLWLKSFALDYTNLGSLSFLPLFEDAEPVQDSIGIHVFFGMARLNYLINYCDLVLERDAPWETVVNDADYLLYWCASMMQEPAFWMDHDDRLKDSWHLPVMEYSQQDIFLALIELSEHMARVPQESIEDLRRFYTQLYLRVGYLFCFPESEKIMNVPNMRTSCGNDQFIPNREFCVFCTIYFHAIMRRFYYYDLRKNFIKPIEELNLAPHFVENVRRWIQTTVMNALGEDGFRQIYDKCVEQGYTLPGDEQWFRYRYPDRQPTTGVILDMIRPYFAQRYFSEYRVSPDVVLSAAIREDHAGYIARLFVLHAVGQYFHGQYTVPWLEGVVVSNDSLEKGTSRIIVGEKPFLIQFLGHHWCYNDGIIYASNNIYETIAIWMYMLHKLYDSQLCGINFSQLISKLLKENFDTDYQPVRI